jgi:hypothetical protein
VAEADLSEWPLHFPVGCPDPADADISGVVYRILDDGRSALERGAFPDKPSCQRAGLSCYRDEEDVRQMRANVPRLMRFKIGRAVLEPKHGKIRQTEGPGHHTLWLRAAVLALHHQLFVVLE